MALVRKKNEVELGGVYMGCTKKPWMASVSFEEISPPGGASKIVSIVGKKLENFREIQREVNLREV